MPASFISMQQSLSEKFGIPTFDMSGKVSTIPRTRPLNTSISVGVGSTGLEQNAFNDLLKRFTPAGFTVPKEEVFIPGIGGNIQQPVGAKPAPGELKLPSSGIGDIFKSGLGAIGGTGLIIGGIVLAILLLKK